MILSAIKFVNDFLSLLQLQVANERWLRIAINDTFPFTRALRFPSLTQKQGKRCCLGSR